MRMLQLSPMWAVILALLGGLRGAVLAQSDEPDEDITWPKLTGFRKYGDDPKQIIHVYEPEPQAEPRPVAPRLRVGAEGRRAGLRDVHGWLWPVRREHGREPLVRAAR